MASAGAASVGPDVSSRRKHTILSCQLVGTQVRLGVPQVAVDVFGTDGAQIQPRIDDRSGRLRRQPQAWTPDRAG